VAFEVQSRADDLAAVWQANLVLATRPTISPHRSYWAIGQPQAGSAVRFIAVEPSLRRHLAARGAGVSAHAPPEDFDGAPRAGAVDIGAFQFH